MHYIGFLRLQSGLGRTVYYSARYHLGATSLRLGPFITMRGLGTARALCYNARYRLGTARALHYNARYRLSTARALCYNARYRLGTARALHYNARRRLGTARALYYNARYRLGTASVPLGPSITMRGTDTPFCENTVATRPFRSSSLSQSYSHS